MATIYINRMDSRCGFCGLEAFCQEPGHMTQAGYSGNGRKGCGQLWDAVSSDYAGLPEMFVKPDDGSYILYKNLIGLPVFAYFETDSIGLYGGKEREHTDG